MDRIVNPHAESTAETPTRVLLVEDDRGDALLVLRGLDRAFRGQYAITHVETVKAAADLLLAEGHGFEAILLDLTLPDAHDLQGLRIISEVTQGTVPVVILTGMDDEALAQSAILQDAQDCISKQEMTEKGLDRALRYSIERHKAQVALRDSRERFRQFARVSSDRFWELDRDLRFKDSVGTLTDDYLPSREDMIGKRRWEIPGYEVAPPDSWESHRADLEAHRPFRDLQLVYTDSEGRKTYWSANGEPVFLDNGEFDGYRGTGTDITAQKLAEADLRRLNGELGQAKEELEALNARKDKFFSIIAHDLRSPFSGMLGTADLFRRGVMGNDAEQNKQYGELMYGAATRALDLVEDLLEWSRLQLGGVSFQPEAFDIADMIRETLDLLRAQAERKGIALPPVDAMPVMVNADRRSVSSVLRNLITNALKFTKQDGTVTVTAAKADGRVAVTVADTGIGIEPKKIDKLFAISEAKTTPGTSGEKGTGMGLVLCKELIEQNGGEITVESTPGEGTTVRFTLPRG